MTKDQTLIERLVKNLFGDSTEYNCLGFLHATQPALNHKIMSDMFAVQLRGEIYKLLNSPEMVESVDLAIFDAVTNLIKILSKLGDAKPEQIEGIVRAATLAAIAEIEKRILHTSTQQHKE